MPHTRKYAKKPPTEIGDVFSRLTVLEDPAERSRIGGRVLICRCQCGAVKRFDDKSLRAGVTKSCGCLASEHSRRQGLSMATHGHCRGGVNNSTREYRSWGNMISRCYNPKVGCFDNYGGRGILVCDEWKNSFATFINDMGPMPDGPHNIDRIDNDKGYFPGNCRWSTPTENGNNKRNNRRFTFFGESLTIAEAARKYNFQRTSLVSRLIRSGISPDDAVTLPHLAGGAVPQWRLSRPASDYLAFSPKLPDGRRSLISQLSRTRTDKTCSSVVTGGAHLMPRGTLARIERTSAGRSSDILNYCCLACLDLEMAATTESTENL